VPISDSSLQHLTALCAKNGAHLLPVTKTRKESDILLLFQRGLRQFGENRAHELVIKASLLPSEIEWHLIGHLQTNKVKSILPYVSCIQSLDSFRLWEKINEEAADASLTIDCYLQIRIAREETKYGWNFTELEEVVASGSHLSLKNVVIKGVMGMASLTDDKDQIRMEMRQLKSWYDLLREKYFSPETLTILSMGMSGDYLIALEEGSNMIRIGSLLFEE
jgi:pyridoxal phosphate enzyme (YggS family)